MYDDESSVPPAPEIAWSPASLDILPPGGASPRGHGRLPLAVAVVAVLAIAAAALVVLGGSSGSKADAATIVRAASQRAASVGSSSVSIDMKMSVAGHTVEATGGGAFDYRSGRGYMSLDMNGVGNMQEVVTRKAFYMRFPDALRAALGTDRPWVEMRFSTLKAASGVDMSKLMNANPTGDPSSILKLLSNARVVHEDGTEDVRGVQTTRYSVSGTMQELLRAEGLTGAVDLSKQAPGAADEQVHFVVSVDKQGLPRRLTMSADVAGMGNMTMTMDMFDFGAPVHVMVPPASVVTDISKDLAL